MYRATIYFIRFLIEVRDLNFCDKKNCIDLTIIPVLPKFMQRKKWKRNCNRSGGTHPPLHTLAETSCTGPTNRKPIWILHDLMPLVRSLRLLPASTDEWPPPFPVP